jgi:excisionase family DNA binding protein
MQTQNAKDAYSKVEAAERLGIGYMTIHRLTKNGTIRTVRAGRRVLIPRAELERFLAGQK